MVCIATELHTYQAKRPALMRSVTRAKKAPITDWIRIGGRAGMLILMVAARRNLSLCAPSTCWFDELTNDSSTADSIDLHLAACRTTSLWEAHYVSNNFQQY